MILTIFAIWLEWVPAHADIRDDTNLYGQDYRNFEADGPSACRNACDDEARCRAWTYVRPGIQGPGGRCWLKDGVPTATADDCCVSGIKTADATPTAPTAPPAADAADAGRPAEVRIGDVTVTFARGATGDDRPVEPTATFTEDDRAVFVTIHNTGTARPRIDVDVFTIDVDGFAPNHGYWTGAWAELPGGQRHSIRVPGSDRGLIPGTYRVDLRVDGRLRNAVLEVTRPFVPTRLLAAGEEIEAGVNVALRALGGEVRADSEWDQGRWRAANLIDGRTSIGRECTTCGWLARRNPHWPHDVDFDLAGDAPVALQAVVIDPKAEGGHTDHLPRRMEVWVSPSATGEDFERVAQARLYEPQDIQAIFERHVIALPDGTEARRVRLRILETRGGRSPKLGEVEIRERLGGESIVAGLDVDLARPAVGGALVRYTGYRDEWTAAKLFDDHPHSWVSYDDYFPQDFTLAFADDRSALIDRLELVFEDRAELTTTWPSEVAIALSSTSPIDGFVEVARVALEQRSGRHVIPVDREARYVKLRVLDNHGADVTTLAELKVIEGRRDDYVPLLVRDDEDAERDREDSDGGAPADAVVEAEPNDDLGTAGGLPLERTLTGLVDPLGERDVFALPELDPEVTALTLDYGGRPYIRHGLSLLDADGVPLAQFDPGDLPARDARLTFALGGDERYLQLTEPPSSVVVVWDTSGSMDGREADLERAVRTYIDRAPAEQRIQLVRFSDEVEVLLEDFTTDKAALQRAVDGEVFARGGTPLYEAVVEALELLGDETGNRAIVVMTDGAHNGRLWHDHFWQAVERDRVRLYTIGLGGGLLEYSDSLATTGRRVLGHLAQATDGDAFFAAESTALEAFYARIADELSRPARYLLTATAEQGTGELRLVATAEQVPSAAMPNIHVIFDVSGSMAWQAPDGRPRIDVAKEAFVAAIRALPDGAPFGLTVYGARVPESRGKDVACRDIATVQDLGPLQKEAVLRFVGDLRPSGGTTPIMASVAHVAERFEPGQDGIILVVTDGIEECDSDPIATLELLKSKRLETIELNVLGFALDDEATKAMMQDLARIGGGRFYDAADGAAIADALREALAATYVARDASEREVAAGRIDGGRVSLPAGSYTVEIAAAGGGARTRDVQVENDRLTTVSVSKVGAEMDVTVGTPEDVDPRRECGLDALKSGETERARRVQEKLNELGYDVGAADGIPGRRTRAGIEAFAQDHGLDLPLEVNLQLEQHLDCVRTIGTTFATASPFR